jgi:methylmalonyl-CoA carboxyltransferase large subunit
MMKDKQSFLLPVALAGSCAAGAVTAVLVARREIAKLRAKGRPAAAAPLPKAPEPQLSDEIVSVLAATVAAFLGKTARIRAIRMLPVTAHSPWAQQGRVYVQGSHNLAALQR